MKNFFASVVSFMLSKESTLLISIALIILLIIEGKYFYAGAYAVFFIYEVVEYVKSKRKQKEKM